MKTFYTLLMSVRVDQKTKLTYEDYVCLPNDGNIHEIIDGDHYMAPAPDTYHQTLSRRIQFALYRQLEEADLGLVFNAPTDVELSAVDIVQPDIFVVSKDKQYLVTRRKIVCPPDLIIEILSEYSGRTDMSLKHSLYERAGVPEYWIVDPEAHEIIKYVLKNKTYACEGAFSETISFSLKGASAVVDLTKVW